MRILLITLGVLVVLIVGIVGIGALLPKKHMATRTVILRATPDQIFALISGPQNWRTDLKGYSSFNEDGRQMLRETDRHGQTITYEILQSQPPTLRKTRIADKNLPFGGSWTWNIQPHAEGCTLTVTEEGEVYNPVFRFVSRFVIGHTRTIDNYLVMLNEAIKQ